MRWEWLPLKLLDKYEDKRIMEIKVITSIDPHRPKFNTFVVEDQEEEDADENQYQID